MSVPDQSDQHWCDLVQGQNIIHIAGFDGGFRHTEIFRRRPVLRDDRAALVLDDLHTEGAITIAAGEDDRDRVFSMDLRH